MDRDEKQPQVGAGQDPEQSATALAKRVRELRLKMEAMRPEMGGPAEPANGDPANDALPEDAPPTETNKQKRQRRYEAEARARETATGGIPQVAPLDPSTMAAFNTPIDALIIPEPEMPPRVDGERVRTEALLNDLIGECHFLMRETAFRSICQCTDPGDRRSFMASAMEFAKTGAEVAGSIARLQGGNAAVVNQTRQLISVEYLEKTPRGEGGGVTP
ncbi:MAG TPA: hypothetical protein VHU87_05455 [Rhizomicrobium sp.]|jgi:hypothetical protein|nr:hypothetical protein [Rhizomicrobium sp.]